jgi:FkbM family methyltransferase
MLTKKIKNIVLNILLDYYPSLYKKRKFKRQNNEKLEDGTATIEPEIFLLNKIIDKSDIVFDIGSNNGEYIHAFEKLVPPPNIYGFEPNENLLLKLKKIFKNVNIFSYALSDVSEKAKLKVPTINKVVYASRGTLNVDFKEIDEEDFTLLNISKIRLDDFIIENNVHHVDFIKIDVEGHEYNVLKGASETLKRFKPVLLIEIEQRHHEYPITLIDEFLINLNYSKFFYDKERKMILPGKEFNVEHHQNIDNLKSIKYINNFFFLPKDKLHNGKYKELIDFRL